MTNAVPPLPQVMQCNIIGHPQFGSTATAAGPNRWLVANPTNGGHWAASGDIADWAALPPPNPVAPAPAPVAPQQDSK